MIPGPAQWAKGSGVVRAVAQIQSLAWELPNASGVPKRERKRKKGIEGGREEGIIDETKHTNSQHRKLHRKHRKYFPVLVL